MARYRSKPREIDAVQWHPGDKVSGVYELQKRGTTITEYYVITIHGQKAFLADGDWIATEPDGAHHYPIKPEIFADRYEAIPG